MAWEGFRDVRCAVGEAKYFVTTGGEGPPVLLLHGVSADPLVLAPRRPRSRGESSCGRGRPEGVRSVDRAAGRPARGGVLEARARRRAQRLLLGDPDAVLDHAFDNWTEYPDAIDPKSRARYRAAITPTTAAAICADYRASFYLDRSHDEADAARRIAVPLLVVVGRSEEQLRDARDVWLRWASSSHLETVTVSGGHFIPEEAPDELADLLRRFLSTS